MQQSIAQSVSYLHNSTSCVCVCVCVCVQAFIPLEFVVYRLIRAAYEEKTDYYNALADNMLQSTRRALETIQKTNE